MSDATTRTNEFNAFHADFDVIDFEFGEFNDHEYNLNRELFESRIPRPHHKVWS